MHLGIEPLERVVLSEDGPIHKPATGLLLLLGVDAVQLHRVVRPRTKEAEVDISRPGLWHRWDAQLAEEVDSIGGDGDSNLHKVGVGEGGELVVAQVSLRVWGSGVMRKRDRRF